jgi:hypothetical protein
MRLIGFSSILSVFALNAALAGEPYVFRHNFNGGSWEFDISSVVLATDGFRRSQMQLYLDKPLQDQATGSVYDRITFLYEHDCALNRMRVVDSLAPAPTGSQPEIASRKNTPAHWQSAAERLTQACPRPSRWRTGGNGSTRDVKAHIARGRAPFSWTPATNRPAAMRLGRA